jgi:glycosyltransferase involved in cell wall biosynthesis
MLVIDARKAHDAGIGTYIRELVPRVLQRLPHVDCTVWLAPRGESWLAQLQERAGRRVAGQVLAARPLSVGEQPALRRALGPGQLLWATSLSHPLFRRAPMIATVHDVAQLALPPALAGGRFTKLAATVYLQSLRLAARELMFVSEFTRREFCRHVGPMRQPATVTPLGVDPGWFGAAGAGDRPQAAPYFVSVSSVRPHKNFGLLVRAFAAVADRLPHQLVIVGESEGLRTVDRDLAQRAATLGERVRFLGRVPDAELRRWVAHADAMVFPSLYEGFGLPPLEALAAGCPVLCSTSGALREVCGDAALYFDASDETDLQRCLLQQSVASAAERKQRVERGLLRARSFDWETTADLAASVLQRHLQPGPAR